MRLPERIPKPLRDSASFLPELTDGEGAWPRSDALTVLESLHGTTIAISDVVLFELLSWGYVPVEPPLALHRLQNEGDADYAQRSRAAAKSFIQECTSASDGALFALTFPMWKDAA
jgi:hypothetical protein